MKLQQGLYLHTNNFTVFNPTGIGAISFKNHKWGKCKTCGEDFYGPPNRRYCDTHSEYIQVTGKKTEYGRYQQEKKQKQNKA